MRVVSPTDSHPSPFVVMELWGCREAEGIVVGQVLVRDGEPGDVAVELDVGGHPRSTLRRRSARAVERHGERDGEPGGGFGDLILSQIELG